MTTQPLKPCPLPVYPCKHCCSDYSWPAEDLFWSEAEQAWVCLECWNDDEEAKGISLADELNRRADTAQELRDALGEIERLRSVLKTLATPVYTSNGDGTESDNQPGYELREIARVALARPEPGAAEDLTKGGDEPLPQKTSPTLTCRSNSQRPPSQFEHPHLSPNESGSNAAPGSNPSAAANVNSNPDSERLAVAFDAKAAYYDEVPYCGFMAEHYRQMAKDIRDAARSRGEGGDK